MYGCQRLTVETVDGVDAEIENGFGLVSDITIKAQEPSNAVVRVVPCIAVCRVAVLVNAFQVCFYFSLAYIIQIRVSR